MFPIFTPTSFHLSHDQTGNFNSSSFYDPLETNDVQTTEFDFEDIFDNYQSLINQPMYQDSAHLDFTAHSSTNHQNGNPNSSSFFYNPLATNNDQTNQFDHIEDIFNNNPSLINQPIYPESTHLDFAAHLSANDENLDFATYFGENEQNLVLEEMITAGSSSHDSINSSCKPQPKKFHIDEVMRERVHAGMKISLRMKTRLEVVGDGYKWRKYGKKKVKTSPYPRNYYHCSTIGCKVKKRIERDTNDPSYVITTYDGVHNHEGYS